MQSNSSRFPFTSYWRPSRPVYSSSWHQTWQLWGFCEQHSTLQGQPSWDQACSNFWPPEAHCIIRKRDSGKVGNLGYNEVTAPQFKTNEQALSWKCWAIGTYEENYYRLKLKNHVLSMQNSVGLLLGIHRFKQKYLEKFRPRPNNTNIIRNFGCWHQRMINKHRKET